MELKQLTVEDYEAIFKLDQFAFQYVLSKEDTEKRKMNLEKQAVWAYMDGKQIMGKLNILPLQIYLNGKAFDMGGISAVATWPEYRRKGIAKRLLRHALKEMKEQGQTVSMLHPFLVGFYRKYGWELTFVNQKYEMPITLLKQQWKGIGYIRRIENNNIDLLSDIYHRYAVAYNGILLRDDFWWKQRVLKDNQNQIAIAYNQHDRVDGYIIYKVKDNQMFIQEIIHLSSNGLQLLYEFISNHDSMAEKVEMTVADDHSLPYELFDPIFSWKKEPYFMARIVDVYHFLKQYPFSNISGKVTLNIEDEFFPENDGQYEICLDSNGSNIEKTNHKDETGISLTVQQLSVIMFGFRRAETMYQNAEFNGNITSVQFLEQMVPKGKTYFPDFF